MGKLDQLEYQYQCNPLLLFKFIFPLSDLVFRVLKLYEIMTCLTIAYKTELLELSFPGNYKKKEYKRNILRKRKFKASHSS